MLRPLLPKPPRRVCPRAPCVRLLNASRVPCAAPRVLHSPRRRPLRPERLSRLMADMDHERGSPDPTPEEARKGLEEEVARGQEPSTTREWRHLPKRREVTILALA